MSDENGNGDDLDEKSANAALATINPKLPQLLDDYAAGKPLADIAKAAGVSRTTIRAWMKKAGDSSLLTHAREARAEEMAERPAKLLDAIDPAGKYARNEIALAREKVGYYRWLASKLDRKAWDDKQPVDVASIAEVIAAFVPLASRPIPVDVVATAPHSEGDVSDEGIGTADGAALPRLSEGSEDQALE